MWEDVTKCLVHAAELSDNFENADRKIKYATAAVEVASKYLPTDHLLYGTALRQKSESLTMTGELEAANRYLLLAITIFEKERDWANLAWSEMILGVNFLNKYQLDSSELHFQKVENIIERKILSEQETVDLKATLLDLRSFLFKQKGRLSESDSKYSAGISS